MNKSWKGIFVTSILCFVFGIALIIVSLMSGGSLTRIRENVSVRSFSKSFADEKITALELDIDVGRLSVIASDEFRVEAENIAADFFVCEVRGGALVVEDNWSNSWSLNLSRGLSFQQEPKIRVYIPDGVKLKFADVSLSAGECSIDGLSTEKLSIAVSAGAFQAVDIRADEFESEVSAGRCRIDSLITKTAKASLSAGELQIHGLQADVFTLDQSLGSAFIGGDIFDRGSFDCGLGKITVALDGRAESEYTVSLDVGLGDVSINGEHFSGSQSLRRGSGDTALDLSCGSGSIELSIG